MRVRVDLDLPGLDAALAGLLPAGVQIRDLEMDEKRLRMGLRAPMASRAVLTADVTVAPGRLTLSGFDIESGGLLRALALGAIRDRLSRLDERHGDLRLWGESDGERAHLSWES